MTELQELIETHCPSAIFTNKQRQSSVESLQEMIPQWILISERLPQSDGFYLVTVHLLSMSNNNYNVQIARFSQFRAKFNLVSGSRAIAWMPLPKPNIP